VLSTKLATFGDTFFLGLIGDTVLEHSRFGTGSPFEGGNDGPGLAMNLYWLVLFLCMLGTGSPFEGGNDGPGLAMNRYWLFLFEVDVAGTLRGGSVFGAAQDKPSRIVAEPMALIALLPTLFP
jgi:hypothetical protein